MFYSGHLFLLAAGVASAVAFVFYGPKPRKSRRDRIGSDSSISGLANYGNQCFVNAVLQSLAACESVISWLQYSLDSANNNNQAFNADLRGPKIWNLGSRKLGEPNKELTICLLKTLRLLNNSESSGEESSPLYVLNALRNHRWTIPNAEEQDAHELFNILTTTLESEFYAALPMYSLKDALLVEDMLTSPTTLITSPGISVKGSDTVISKKTPKSIPSKGLLASQLQCKTCSYKFSIHLDCFTAISLTIPDHIMGAPVLLQDCLDKYVSNEIIHEVTCDGCSKNGGKASFIKKMTFAKLPPLLCFHIHRLVWLDNGMLMKRTEGVVFPEYLNMDDYVYSKQTQKRHSHLNNLAKIGLMGGQAQALKKEYWQQSIGIPSNLATGSAHNDGTLGHTPSESANRYRYRLCSSLHHLGTANTGHFITYRRASNAPDSKWFFTSDLNVQEIELKDVLSAPSSAYMLFYERIK